MNDHGTVVINTTQAAVEMKPKKFQTGFKSMTSVNTIVMLYQLSYQANCEFAVYP